MSRGTTGFTLLRLVKHTTTAPHAPVMHSTNHITSSSSRISVEIILLKACRIHLYQAITLFVQVSRECHDEIGSVPSLLLELYSLVAEDTKILMSLSSKKSNQCQVESRSP